MNSDSIIKDDLIGASQRLLHNFEEVETFTSTRMSKLKAFASQKEIDLRPVYGRNFEHMKRVTTFCGTGNDRQLYDATTSGRRMVTFWVESIVDPRLYPINYEGVYAQANALMEDGFIYWLEDVDIATLEEHNINFMVPNLERELVNTYYRVPGEMEDEIPLGTICRWVTVAQVMEHYGGNKLNLHASRIGKEMRELGFKSKRGKGDMMYWVAERTLNEIQHLSPFNTDDNPVV